MNFDVLRITGLYLKPESFKPQTNLHSDNKNLFRNMKHAYLCYNFVNLKVTSVIRTERIGLLRPRKRLLWFQSRRDLPLLMQVVYSTISHWHVSRWHHQAETFSALLALCDGNSPVTGGFPSQRPVARGLRCFLSCAAGQTAVQTVKMLVILDAMALIKISL